MVKMNGSFLIVLFAVGLLLISGCSSGNNEIGQKNIMPENAITKTQNNEKCQDQNDQQSYYNCVFRLAIDSNDASLCEKLPQDSFMSDIKSCYYAFAENTQDTSVCKRLKEIYGDKTDSAGVTSEHRCIGNTALVAAFINKDMSKCDTLSATQQNKDECYRYYASAYKEIKVCEKIVDEFYRQSCIELAK